ncbi:MAG: helix-turn-helix domain-containing protein [Paracoccaceae bacterium]
MTDKNSYGQFCPLSMATEIVCTRWTPLIIREFPHGTTRFNDLRRGLPKLSPALLSKRLKELEKDGVITAETRPDGNPEYRLTTMGRALEPMIMALGTWGHQWVESSVSLRNLDPSLLMWDMRRNIAPRAMPRARCTIQFLYPELTAGDRNWWLVIEDGDVDLCKIDPGHEVDILIKSSLRAMTAIWMGMTTVRDELAARRIEIDGESGLVRSIDKWLGLSHFAPLPRKVS